MSVIFDEYGESLRLEQCYILLLVSLDLIASYLSILSSEHVMLMISWTQQGNLYLLIHSYPVSNFHLHECPSSHKVTFQSRWMPLILTMMQWQCLGLHDVSSRSEQLPAISVPIIWLLPYNNHHVGGLDSGSTYCLHLWPISSYGQGQYEKGTIWPGQIAVHGSSPRIPFGLSSF